MVNEALTGIPYLEDGGEDAHAAVNRWLNLLAITATRWIVVNETTTNAPGSPSNGDAYIVSGTPTASDAWDLIGAGDEDIVFYYDGWFLFGGLREGILAWNLATNTERRYNGSTWEDV